MKWIVIALFTIVFSAVNASYSIKDVHKKDFKTEFVKKSIDANANVFINDFCKPIFVIKFVSQFVEDSVKSVEEKKCKIKHVRSPRDALRCSFISIS